MIQAQILDKFGCISLHAYTFGKAMSQSFLFPAIDKIV